MESIEAFLLRPSPSLADTLLSRLSFPDIAQFCKTSKLKGSELLDNLSKFNKLDLINDFGIEQILSLLQHPHLRITLINCLSAQDVPEPCSYQLILTMLNFISQEDLGCAISAKNFIVRKLNRLFLNDEVLQALKKMMESADSTIQLRYIELAIEAGNKDPEVFNALANINAYEIAIDMFTSDDLLSRLASIETVAELGNSEQGCKILLKEKVRNMIRDSVEDNFNDIYTRAKLLLLACKIYSYTGNTELLQGRFWTIVEAALRSTDDAMINNGLTGISIIASRPTGTSLIADQADIVAAFARLQNSANINSKTGFYLVFSEIASHSDEDSIRKILSSIRWIDPILRELSAPFQDILVSILKATKGFLRFPYIVQQLYAQPKFAEFMLKRTMHDGPELVYLRYEINQKATQLELDDLLKDKLNDYVREGVYPQNSGFIEEAITNAK